MIRSGSWTVALAAALLGGAAAFIRLGDPDVWWHLATGRLILGGEFPSVNAFAHTFPDYPFSNPYWLFQALAALVERLGGVEAVGLIPPVMIAAACVLTIASARRLSGPWSPAVALGLLVIALSASRFRFVPRPELFSNLGMAVVLYLWVKRPRGAFYWLALTGCLWANAHPGVFFGLAGLACLALADGWIDRRIPRRWCFAALFAFLGGSLVNPQGVYPYLYTFIHAGANEIYPVAEFKPPAWPMDATFFLGATLVTLAAISSLRSGRRRLPLLAVLFGIPALLYLRLIPIFFLATLPDAVNELSRRREALGKRGWAWGRPVAAGLLVAAALLAVRDYRLNAPPIDFGWGVNHDWVPEGGAAFVRSHSLRGKMYNDYDHGGYFAWSLFPDYGIFVDGRVLAYPQSFYDELGALPTVDQWSIFLDRFGVDFAVAQRFVSRGGDLGPVFEALEWPLVYMDGVSLIYLRRGSEDAARLDQLRYRTLRSGDDLPTIQRKAEGEPEALLHDIRLVAIDRLIEPGDFIRFAGAAAVAGDRGLAEKILSIGLAKHPGNPDLSRLRSDLPLLLPRR